MNVHPAKTEVRFRQPSFVHDFIRDTVRTTLMNARPAASFAAALSGAPFSGASASLLLDVSPLPGGSEGLQQPFFESARGCGDGLRRRHRAGVRRSTQRGGQRVFRAQAHCRAGIAWASCVWRRMAWHR